jgi:rhomboid protease GluP
MPEKTEIINQAGYDADLLQTLAYGVLEQLNWNIKYAGDTMLVAYTPRSWNKWDLEITVETTASQLTVTSKQIHNEGFDMAGRNKKHIAQFLKAFEETKKTANENQIQQWTDKIGPLKQSTVTAAEQEVKQAEEINKVMNLSTGTMYVTYGLIAINVLLFTAMLIGGAGIFEPDGYVHANWGSNYTALTLSGDWWRLLTCTFLHFGIIHLALNMYALYNIGIFLEPMLGRTRFLAAYLCTGVLASVVSLWWHKEGVNSAGASGAIFGLVGLLLAFIVTKYIPAVIRKSLLQSVGLMAVYSLIYGLKGGVDNAAHIGGLISGFAIGYIYWLTLKPEKRLNIKPVVASIVLLTVVTAGFYLKSNAVGNAEREKSLNELANLTNKGSKLYYIRYNEFVEWQNKALAIYKDGGAATGFDSLSATVAMPARDKAGALLQEMEKMNVTANMHRQTRLLKEYVQLRKEELKLRLVSGFNDGKIIEINRNAKQIDSVMNLFNVVQQGGKQ